MNALELNRRPSISTSGVIHNDDGQKKSELLFRRNNVDLLLLQSPTRTMDQDGFSLSQLSMLAMEHEHLFAENNEGNDINWPVATRNTRWLTKNRSFGKETSRGVGNIPSTSDVVNSNKKSTTTAKVSQKAKVVAANDETKDRDKMSPAKAKKISRGTRLNKFKTLLPKDLFLTTDNSSSSNIASSKKNKRVASECSSLPLKSARICTANENEEQAFNENMQDQHLELSCCNLFANKLKSAGIIGYNRRSRE